MLEELVSTRYRALVGFATLLGGPSDAEDLVQDALAHVFSRRVSFPTIGHAEAYVRRAIATRFLDGRRSALRRFRRERAVARPESVRGDEAMVADRIDIAEALAALPPRVRACVVLRYLSDLSTAETAASLRLSEGAVKRYVSDGVRALAIALGEPPEASLGEVESARVQRLGGSR